MVHAGDGVAAYIWVCEVQPEVAARVIAGDGVTVDVLDGRVWPFWIFAGGVAAGLLSLPLLTPLLANRSPLARVQVHRRRWLSSMLTLLHGALAADSISSTSTHVSPLGMHARVSLISCAAMKGSCCSSMNFSGGKQTHWRRLRCSPKRSRRPSHRGSSSQAGGSTRGSHGCPRGTEQGRCRGSSARSAPRRRAHVSRRAGGLGARVAITLQIVLLSGPGRLCACRASLVPTAAQCTSPART